MPEAGICYLAVSVVGRKIPQEALPFKDKKNQRKVFKYL